MAEELSLWQKIEKSLKKHSEKGGGDCILWKGSLDSDGYGKMRIKWGPQEKSRVEKAHRLSYMLKHTLTRLPHTSNTGELMDVSHRCHHKACINSDHLVWENRLSNKARDTCYKAGSCTLKHDPPCIL